MELTISKKEKNKAQRNRIHKEKKWRPFKMVYHFSFLIAICSLVYGVLIVTSTNYIDFYTESDKNVDGSIKALKNVTGIGKNSKVFSIFDKYGTKTVKTIEDVVGLIGG